MEEALFRGGYIELYSKTIVIQGRTFNLPGKLTGKDFLELAETIDMEMGEISDDAYGYGAADADCDDEYSYGYEEGYDEGYAAGVIEGEED